MNGPIIPPNMPPNGGSGAQPNGRDAFDDLRQGVRAADPAKLQNQAIANREQIDQFAVQEFPALLEQFKQMTGLAADAPQTAQLALIEQCLTEFQTDCEAMSAVSPPGATDSFLDTADFDSFNDQVTQARSAVQSFERMASQLISAQLQDGQTQEDAHALVAAVRTKCWDLNAAALQSLENDALAVLDTSPVLSITEQQEQLRTFLAATVGGESANYDYILTHRDEGSGNAGINAAINPSTPGPESGPESGSGGAPDSGPGSGSAGADPAAGSETAPATDPEPEEGASTPPVADELDDDLDDLDGFDDDFDSLFLDEDDGLFLDEPESGGADSSPGDPSAGADPEVDGAESTSTPASETELEPAAETAGPGQPTAPGAETAPDQVGPLKPQETVLVVRVPGDRPAGQQFCAPTDQEHAVRETESVLTFRLDRMLQRDLDYDLSDELLKKLLATDPDGNPLLALPEDTQDGTETNLRQRLQAHLDAGSDGAERPALHVADYARIEWAVAKLIGVDARWGQRPLRARVETTTSDAADGDGTTSATPPADSGQDPLYVRFTADDLNEIRTKRHVVETVHAEFKRSVEQAKAIVSILEKGRQALDENGAPRVDDEGCVSPCADLPRAQTVIRARSLGDSIAGIFRGWGEGRAFAVQEAAHEGREASGVEKFVSGLKGMAHGAKEAYLHVWDRLSNVTFSRNLLDVNSDTFKALSGYLKQEKSADKKAADTQVKIHGLQNLELRGGWRKGKFESDGDLSDMNLSRSELNNVLIYRCGMDSLILNQSKCRGLKLIGNKGQNVEAMGVDFGYGTSVYNPDLERQRRKAVAGITADTNITDRRERREDLINRRADQGVLSRFTGMRTAVGRLVTAAGTVAGLAGGAVVGATGVSGLLPAAGLVVAGGLLGYAAGSIIKNNASLKGALGLSGFGAGASCGAVLGTAIAGPVGTAVGWGVGAVGAFALGQLGYTWGERMSSHVDKASALLDNEFQMIELHGSKLHNVDVRRTWINGGRAYGVKSDSVDYSHHKAGGDLSRMERWRKNILEAGGSSSNIRGKLWGLGLELYFTWFGASGKWQFLNRINVLDKLVGGNGQFSGMIFDQRCFNGKMAEAFSPATQYRSMAPYLGWVDGGGFVKGMRNSGLAFMQDNPALRQGFNRDHKYELWFGAGKSGAAPDGQFPGGVEMTVQRGGGISVEKRNVYLVVNIEDEKTRVATIRIVHDLAASSKARMMQQDDADEHLLLSGRTGYVYDQLEMNIDKLKQLVHDFRNGRLEAQITNGQAIGGLMERKKQAEAAGQSLHDEQENPVDTDSYGSGDYGIAWSGDAEPGLGGSGIEGSGLNAVGIEGSGDSDLITAPDYGNWS